MLAIAFAALGIKMFLKKDGAFHKHCSVVDPKTGKPLGCTCGDNKVGECHNNDKTKS